MYKYRYKFCFPFTLFHEPVLLIRMELLMIILVHPYLKINYVNSCSNLFPLHCSKVHLCACKHHESLREILLMISLVHIIDSVSWEQSHHLLEIVLYGFACINMDHVMIYLI